MSDELKNCPFCGSSNTDPEGWASHNPETGEYRKGPTCDDCGASADSVAAWNRRAVPQQVPGAKWKLVPVEPDVKMLAAFWRVKNTGSTEVGETGDDRSDYAAYRAMLSAVPQHSDELKEGIARIVEPDAWAERDIDPSLTHWIAPSLSKAVSILRLLEENGVGACSAERASSASPADQLTSVVAGEE